MVSTGKADGASLYAGFYGLAFERAGCLIGKGMKVLRRIALSLCLALAGCSDEETGDEVGKPGEGALERSKKIRELEKSLERLRWENTRLSLKMKSVGGGSLVRDKVTGLWHHDVEREPFTGRALEKFPGGSQRAEADFLNGKKDGMERFWHANGRLKSEGQWFDGETKRGLSGVARGRQAHFGEPLQERATDREPGRVAIPGSGGLGNSERPFDTPIHSGRSQKSGPLRVWITSRTRIW